jgi:spermidine synthase
VEYAEGKKGNYDLIVADAFVDDSIPVHLITREAIARHISHLAGPNGILAVHASSRHLDLLPMLTSIAREERLSIFFAETVVQNATTYPSQWVLFCARPNLQRCRL